MSPLSWIIDEYTLLETWRTQDFGGRKKMEHRHVAWIDKNKDKDKDKHGAADRTKNSENCDITL